MRLYDQHLHSRHSFDSKADPARNVEAAIERGLAGLTFTEHFDVHPEDWKTCCYDDAAYSETIASLRERYGRDIFVGKGIEICYQPDHLDFILDFLAGHRFDLVMLSVHYFADRQADGVAGPTSEEFAQRPTPNGAERAPRSGRPDGHLRTPIAGRPARSMDTLAGRAVHKRETWDSMAPAEGTRRYLESVLEAAAMCRRVNAGARRVFDVLGHLDYVKRYTQRFFSGVDVDAGADLIEAILQTCLEADLIPEINTSTLRGDLDETMPGPDAVKIYARLGGTCMSLGSDAHESEHIGSGFDRAVQMLRDAGIGHTAVFKERELTREPFATRD